MSAKKRQGTLPSPKVLDETEMHRRLLRRLIARHGKSQRQIERKLKTGRGFISQILGGWRPLLFEHLYAILGVLGVPPEKFFAELHVGDPGRSGAPLVRRFEDAPGVLGQIGPLRPGTSSFTPHYVKRPWDATDFVSRVLGARRARRPFHGFLAGQRGAGLTTELCRLLAASRLEDYHRLAFLDLPRPLGEVQVLRAMAAGLADLLRESGRALAEPLRAHVEAWEIFPDLEIFIERLENGDEPPNPSAPPLGDVIDPLVAEVREQFGVPPLLVIDGWTRWDLPALAAFLAESLDRIERPGLSTVLAIPTALLYRPLATRLEHRTTIVLPVPIFRDPSQAETVDEAGQLFFDELIHRYLPIGQIADTARESLCRLSGGLPGEMIARTREACVVAAKEGRRWVNAEALAVVEEETESRIRSALEPDDVERLERIAADPFGEGVDDLPRLLQMNFVLLQPGYGGWLAVHPALRRLLEEKA